MGHKGVEYEPAELPRKKKTKAGVIFLRVMEILTIGLSYFSSNAIVRFLTTKVAMDMTVEVTARFGAPAGHRFSSVMAALVAEPRLIAVVVTAVILALNGIVFILRGIADLGRDRRARRYQEQIRLEKKREAMYRLEQKEADRRAKAREEFEAAAMERRRRALKMEPQDRRLREKR